MLIGASDGHGFRYEVIEWTDGYLVHARDVDTGVIEETEAKVFRTAAVALRYAEMSAAFDRLAAARIAGEPTEAHEAELDALKELYDGLSCRLGDDGMAAHILAAWDVQSSAVERRRYH
jgi:hypothetical protein